MQRKSLPKILKLLMIVQIFWMKIPRIKEAFHPEPFFKEREKFQKNQKFRKISHLRKETRGKTF